MFIATINPNLQKKKKKLNNAFVMGGEGGECRF